MAVRYTTHARRELEAQGCSVTVYDAGTSNVSTIYCNPQGDAKDNPFVWAGGEEGPTFYAAVGEYDVTVEGVALPTLQRFEVEEAANREFVGVGSAAAPSVAFEGDPDTGLYRVSANVLGLTAGGTAKVQVSASGLVITTLANGQAITVAQATAQSTALASGGTYAFTDLIPAASIVLGVTIRVTTLITGATSLTIGDGTDATRWGTGIDVIKDTVTTLADCTEVAVPIYAAKASVVVTATGGNFTAGVIRATVHYIKLTAATS
jgi:hypothetical protein